jgi:hypothetical protein
VRAFTFTLAVFTLGSAAFVLAAVALGFTFVVLALAGLTLVGLTLVGLTLVGLTLRRGALSLGLAAGLALGPAVRRRAGLAVVALRTGLAALSRFLRVCAFLFGVPAPRPH